MIYQVHLLKDSAQPDTRDLAPFLRDTLLPSLADAGARAWGIFHGLFGLASNEVYLVLNSDRDAVPLAAHLTGPFAERESIRLLPTVRPTAHDARTADGVYVFRWFDVHPGDVDEIARLSEQAWVTFEGGFDTEVQGLFAEAPEAATPRQTSEQARGKMLLVTRYRDLSVWEDSRRPPPAARENFMRRHALTLEAKPIATRLLRMPD